MPRTPAMSPVVGTLRYASFLSDCCRISDLFMCYALTLTVPAISCISLYVRFEGFLQIGTLETQICLRQNHLLCAFFFNVRFFSQVVLCRSRNSDSCVRQCLQYGVATMNRLLQIISLFCRISSVWQGSFAKETYNFKEPTNRSHPIVPFFVWSLVVRNFFSMQTSHVKRRTNRFLESSGCRTRPLKIGGYQPRLAQNGTNEKCTSVRS